MLLYDDINKKVARSLTHSLFANHRSLQLNIMPEHSLPKTNLSERICFRQLLVFLRFLSMKNLTLLARTRNRPDLQMIRQKDLRILRESVNIRLPLRLH